MSTNRRFEVVFHYVQVGDTHIVTGQVFRDGEYTLECEAYYDHDQGSKGAWERKRLAKAKARVEAGVMADLFKQLQKVWVADDQT